MAGFDSAVTCARFQYACSMSALYITDTVSPRAIALTEQNLLHAAMPLPDGNIRVFVDCLAVKLFRGDARFPKGKVTPLPPQTPHTLSKHWHIPGLDTSFRCFPSYPQKLQCLVDFKVRLRSYFRKHIRPYGGAFRT